MSVSRRTRWEPGIRWFVLLGGMAAFALHLVSGFYLVPVSCLLGTRLPLYAVTVVFAGVALAATWMGWTRRHAAGDDLPPPWPHGRGSRVDRARFMIHAGILLNVFGLLIILYAGATILVFDPCVNWRV
jgi:hypothetical protein